MSSVHMCLSTVHARSIPLEHLLHVLSGHGGEQHGRGTVDEQAADEAAADEPAAVPPAKPTDQVGPSDSALSGSTPAA